jgi:hypothetical protein
MKVLAYGRYEAILIATDKRHGFFKMSMFLNGDAANSAIVTAVRTMLISMVFVSSIFNGMRGRKKMRSSLQIVLLSLHSFLETSHGIDVSFKHGASYQHSIKLHDTICSPLFFDTHITKTSFDVGS